MKGEPVFNAGGNDSYENYNEEYNDKDTDGRDGIKAPHGWNKVCERRANKKFKKKCEQCQETCSSKNSNKRKSPKKKKGGKAKEASNKDSKNVEKKGKEKLIDSGINLEDQTPEQTLQKIAAFHNMTVEELLVANNILKDDNPENLQEEKIERPGIKKLNYRDFSSDDNSNEKKETNNEIESGKEVDESAKKRRIDREEEDKNNEEEVANNVDQIAVETDPALQEGNRDKNKEEAANDTDPIAVAADPALQEENKTTWKDYLPRLASWL
eukprot:jgi/Psemu1/21319/gm1.21319_g